MQSENNREPHQRKTINKSAQQMRQQPKQLSNNQTMQQQKQQQHSEQRGATDHDNGQGEQAQSQLNQIDSKDQDTQQQIRQSGGTKKQNQSNEEPKDEAVVFAEHIQVNFEDVSQYTFGFFEEPKNLTKSNEIFIANNSQKQTSPSNQVQKQLKASPNSEQRSYKYNDNIDPNSFNYKQILCNLVEFHCHGEYLSCRTNLSYQRDFSQFNSLLTNINPSFYLQTK